MRSLIAVIATLLALEAAAAPCFAPLANPESWNPTDWDDLVNRVPRDADKAPGVKRFLPISNGTGEKINLDYYAITFSKHPSKPVETVFAEIREKLSEIVLGPKGDYKFFPYGPLQGAADASKRNRELWSRKDPTGALMTFSFGQLALSYPGFPMFSMSHKDGGARLVGKNGDVQVICASELDFVFATADTELNGPHPVAGVRGFGLRVDPNGRTWTFYIKAADRTSDFLVSRVIGNGTFSMGERFWDYFFDSLTRYLEKNGMKVQGELHKNSRRYNYTQQYGHQNPPPSLTVTFFAADFGQAPQSEGGGSLFVHAFTCIGVPLNTGIKEDCYGFYPVNRSKAVIGGPGRTHADDIKRVSDIAKSAGPVTIDEAKRRAIFAEIDRWEGENYQLSMSNCIDLVHALAGIVGLARPPRLPGQLPHEYISQLKLLNGL